jgi:F0F1-type ATP synthase assembly protein I
VPKRLGRGGDLWAQVGFYSSLGFILPAGAVAGYMIGWLLDGWLHTRPVLAIVMAFVGVAGGIVEVVRLLTREEKRADGNDSSPRGDD